MIKATGERDGRRFVLLGLSEGNLQLLREGKPIVVALEALGLPHHLDVVIHYGETERALINELRPLFQPGMILHVDGKQ